jgi:hypothetical protein
MQLLALLREEAIAHYTLSFCALEKNSLNKQLIVTAAFRVFP